MHTRQAYFLTLTIVITFAYFSAFSRNNVSFKIEGSKYPFYYI
jgi:hypothetical protein